MPIFQRSAHVNPVGDLTSVAGISGLSVKKHGRACRLQRGNEIAEARMGHRDNRCGGYCGQRSEVIERVMGLDHHDETLLCQAAIFSFAADQVPEAAMPFIFARWVKAACPAATFSGLPPHAFRAACCSARP